MKPLVITFFGVAALLFGLDCVQDNAPSEKQEKKLHYIKTLKK